MSIDQFLADYGYVAIVIGCFLEGETLLVLGGFAAHAGYLNLPTVMLAGFGGGVFGDQLYFYLGRHYGPRMLARRPHWQAAVARVEARLARHRDLFIVGFRFVYGLRVVSPLVISLTAVSTLRYTMLNVLGGVVWAVSIALLGYLFGHAMQTFVADFQSYELQALAVIAALGVLFLVVRRSRARTAPDSSAVAVGDATEVHASTTQADGTSRARTSRTPSGTHS
ncbi:MAG: DedA family protein [Planctomycetota bacterium]